MGKFDGFNIVSTDYKKVAGQGIAVDLLIPSKLAAGSHPVIVRFHGGGYVSTFGSSRVTNAALSLAGVLNRSSGQRIESV